MGSFCLSALLHCEAHPRQLLIQLPRRVTTYEILKMAKTTQKETAMRPSLRCCFMHVLLFFRAAVVHHVLLAGLLRELPYEGLALCDFEVNAGVVRLVLDELVILARQDRVQQDTDE